MKIKVLDSPMGYGKTTKLIDMMNEHPNESYIFITPFLSEVQRIKENCSELNFKEPRTTKGSKLNGLKRLINNGDNIVSTHSLFNRADKELIELLEESGYVLILDEVANVIEQADITKDDIEILVNEKLVEVKDDGLVHWMKDNYKGRFIDLKHYCHNDSVYYINDIFLVWTLPISIFSVFKDVIVSTYQFEWQLQKYYYDFFNVEYEYFHIVFNDDGSRSIARTIDFSYEKDFVDKIKPLINICDIAKLNAIGEPTRSEKQHRLTEGQLSKTWYDSKKESIRVTPHFTRLSNNMYNYFQNICKTKSADVIWTTFKDYKSDVSPKGYAKGFIPMNARATNEYGDRHCLAYCCNRFMSPYQTQFFASRGIEVNQDMWALSEMLQWIWRSAIRNGEAINIYIPSKRMRELLIDWLNITDEDSNYFTFEKNTSDSVLL